MSKLWLFELFSKLLVISFGEWGGLYLDGEQDHGVFKPSKSNSLPLMGAGCFPIALVWEFFLYARAFGGKSASGRIGGCLVGIRSRGMGEFSNPFLTRRIGRNKNNKPRGATLLEDSIFVQSRQCF